MRFATVASILLSVGLSVGMLACSKPETPEPAQAPAAAPAQVAPPAAAEKPKAAAKAAANPLGTPLPTLKSIPLHTPPGLNEDSRRQPTPCDRNEPGWKWVGNVVEDGKCAVGPCDCVKE